MPHKPRVAPADILPYLHRADLYTREVAAMFGYKPSYVTDLRRKYGTGPGRRGGPNAAKVGADQVREIRERAENGETFTDIAPLFGITRGNVGHIVSGRSWPDA